MKNYPPLILLAGTACWGLCMLAGCQTPYSKSEEKDPLGYLIESEPENSSSDYDPLSRMMDSGKLH